MYRKSGNDATFMDSPSASCVEGTNYNERIVQGYDFHS